jgi:hypothetical protein
MRTTAILVALVTMFLSCDKNKRTAANIDGEAWLATEVTIDGNPSSVLAEIRFAKCDIYEESCKGNLKTIAGGHSHIAWQVGEKGKLFSMNNQSDHASGGADLEAVRFTKNISGEYKVLRSNRKDFEISSESTAGFNGKKVTIIFKRK